jgi:hypothetical protein
MPSKAKPAKRTQHNPRKWITAALEGAGPDGLPTSQLMRRAASMAGTKIPEFSIYSALRTLKKHKLVTSRRHGHELTFKLAKHSKADRTQAGQLAMAVRAETPAPEAPVSAPSSVAAVTSEPSAIASTSPAGATLHKLAVGEAVILHVGETHVETATNVHGKIVLEKHRRP